MCKCYFFNAIYNEINIKSMLLIHIIEEVKYDIFEQFCA